MSTTLLACDFDDRGGDFDDRGGDRVAHGDHDDNFYAVNFVVPHNIQILKTT